MEEKEKLIDISKKIGLEFGDIKVGFVDKTDMVKFFKNKEESKLSQMEFFMKAVNK
ncbi:MAG: hypothetical protein RBR53_02320 [Desulforegulaceae bacterium]|nr:hypothetical protein [Desulforegulaceae bacterium]